MIRKSLLTQVLILLLLPTCGGTERAEDETPGKPNIVFILADDLGWKDLGCYGSSFYETPYLDRFAMEGMRFTNAYAASPVCSPTRASIMSGKDPVRVGITDWIPGRQANRGAHPSEELLSPEIADHLSLEEITIAEELKRADYRTFFAGKWHLGGEGHYPEAQGFDINIAGTEFGWPRGGYFSPYDNRKINDGPDGEYLTDRLTDETINFIRENQKDHFLAFLSYYSVHNPLEAKEDVIRKYERKQQALPPIPGERFLPEGHLQARQVQDHPTYAAMIESMDQNIGKLIATLDELGLSEKTVVFFMSDNGGLSTAEGSPTSNVPLRGGKGWLFEGGIRVPMIARWNGVIGPNSICAVPVISMDFYPTILELAGLEPTADVVDGTSIVTLLKGEEAHESGPLFWHYPHYSNQGGSPAGAIRLGNLKLIERYEDQTIQLYDLDEDIGETRDISAEKPEMTTHMRQMLVNWRESLGAEMPTPNPEYDPTAPIPDR